MAASDIVVYDSVMGSNLSRPQKSLFARMFEETLAPPCFGQTKLGLTRQQFETGWDAFRKTVESTGTAGVLAFLNAYMANGSNDDGLDWKVFGWEVPVDAVLGFFGIIGGVAIGGHQASTTAVNVGAQAAGIYAFRKLDGLFRLLKAGGISFNAAGESDMGVDPIIEAAKTL